MDKFISNWFYSPLGSYEVEKGVFKKRTEKHHSERYVDFDDYADKIKQIYTDFDAQGYDVVNVIPINMGQSEASIGQTKQLIPEKRYLGDVGFSITRGAVVVGKRKDEWFNYSML